jgi:hypothetical protein
MKNLMQTITVMVCAAVAAIFLTTPISTAADKAKKRDRPLERTRETVKMLDDVYKTAVVLITTHYVNDEDDLPAGTAAIALFDAVGKKGWHQVRLIDASGDPIETSNSARDDFEKAAVKKLKAGASWHEEVIEKDGKRYLRAATPIPVVLEKCTMCHDNYKKFKKNEPIGALSYTIPIK